MAIVYRVAKGSPLTNAEVDANFLHLDTIKANKAITVTGTNGLTGGGNLSANRTLELGTPSTLTTTSTNSSLISNGTSHTHALDLSGRSVISGNGLVGGRDLGADVTLAIGTPSTLTTTSTNSASGQTHNHKLDLSGRSINSGDGLKDGGNLGSNLTLNVDASVVRTKHGISGGTYLNYKVGTVPQFFFHSGAGAPSDAPLAGQQASAMLMSNTWGDPMIAITNIGAGFYWRNGSSTVWRQAAEIIRLISTGDGLSGGGNLTANRTLTVDSTVVRTSGNQTIGGIKTFSSAVILSTAGTATTHAVRADRTITTGSGLTGGGNLTANRTLTVDSTVVRTSGNQTIGGIKTFSSAVILSTAGTATTHAVRADRAVIAGNGLTGGGNLTSNKAITLGTPSTLTATTTNSSLISNGTSHTHNIEATASRTSASTTALLIAGGMNDHRVSGDHDARYAQIPSGTKMLFQQSAAPTGWTKDLTHNNKALRVVTGAAGSGGALAFTSALGWRDTSSTGTHSHTITVNNHTLSEEQMPVHSHWEGGAHYPYFTHGSTYSKEDSSLRRPDGGTTPSGVWRTETTGSSFGHNHNASSASTGNHSHSLDMRVQYVDLIIATRS